MWETVYNILKHKLQDCGHCALSYYEHGINLEAMHERIRSIAFSLKGAVYCFYIYEKDF